MSESLYRRWIIANAWSEGIGLSATLGLGFLAAPYLEAGPGPGPLLLGALFAVLLGTALEGTLVGIAQGRVLHRRLSGISAGSWTSATSIGACAAWLLGVVPSTVMGLLHTGEALAGSAAPIEPAAWLQLGLAAVMGLVLGPVLAFPQHRVLRREIPQASGWLGANALAWAVGMPLLFLGMDALAWDGPWVGIAVGVVAVCTGAGATVGAIHGAYLRRLLKEADGMHS